MNTAKLFVRHIAATLGLGLALLVAGCGNSGQQKAYEQAAAAEQRVTSETLPHVIAQFEEVIRLQPGSAWARKARARVEALQAKAKAEEQRKAVFQEHGVD